MPIDIIMPKVDMVMDEGTVATWHKSEGDWVQAGEPLFDIATDKATMEVEAPASGTLVRITAPDGATVPVATVIAMLLEPGEQPPGEPENRRTENQEPRTKNQEPENQEPPRGYPTENNLQRTTDNGQRATDKIRATPLARRLARAHGLDIALLSGGGSQGRVRKDDVLRAIETRRAISHPTWNGKPLPAVPAATPAPEHLAPAEAPVATPAPEHLAPADARFADGPAEAGRLVSLVGVRKIIAQRLAISATIPQFVLSIDVDLSAAMQLRERLAYRPSVTAILARVVAAVLPRHPSLNASFRDDGIWLHTPVHLGIALDSGGDLLVPVIRNVHQRTLSDIAATISDIRQRAEAKKLMPSELQGSTFSISNLGMLGVDQFTALVNPPEAAILAVGRSARRPIELDGAIIFKPMITLTLSADHRVTDGVAAARFLQDIRAALEEPLLLL